MVLVRSLSPRIRLPLDRLRRVARLTLNALGSSGADLHLMCVDDRAIRSLNRRFLGKNRSTDVLAFEADEAGNVPLLGEIVISWETARRQAKRLGHSLEEELSLMTIHGLLHLVGYDDTDPTEARLMHERERSLFVKCVGKPSPTLWNGLLPA